MDTEDDKLAGRLAGVVLESLDAGGDAGELARRAYQSRSGFFRLFQALIEESPGAMRRRLLLERAAWQLARTPASVTDIAFDANYGSLEAFSRAYRAAFGLSPSMYRRTGGSRIHLPAPNAFHFRPTQSQLKGADKTMDLFDLFAGTESWYTRRLLQEAARLSDEQLDQSLDGIAKVFPWDKPDRNLREILERMVETKEVWAAALTGGDMPVLDGRPAKERAPGALLERFEKAESEFHRILRGVRDRGAWDESFVDALCEPAETFTYGAMFAHVITFNAYRRLTALDAFHRLGVKMQGSGCPTEYEATIIPRPVGAK
jgi:AraC family transcriptional regulator